jgi:hypothetical protein
MSLTTDQVSEAVEQMKVHCRLLNEQRNFDGISARAALYTLGYGGDNAEQVLQHIFDGGFTYCLDPDYHRSSQTDPGRISAGVCYWEPCQLLSRLECLR